MTTDDGDLARRLFALIPDGLWVFDDEGTTTWANPRMAEILGRTPEEMVGLSVLDTLDDQGRADFRRHLDAMVASGEARENVDAYFVRADGTAVWALVSYVPVVEDGRRTGWLHRVTPDTERKELLDALGVTTQQLSTAQRIAQLGSWSWDIETDVVEWSDEMCRIFGVAPGSAVTFADYVSRLHPDEQAETSAAIAVATETGEEYSFDHRIVRSDGEVRWLRGRGAIERRPDGTAYRMSGTAQDITSSRLADQAAQEATRRLELAQQMTTAANLAGSLREALQVAGAGLPVHTSWGAIGALLWTDEGEPEHLALHSGPTRAEFDPWLAEEARASAQVTVGAAPGLERTHSVVAMPVLLDGEVISVVELLADEVPPDENSHQLLAQIAHQLAVVAERERSAAQLAEARDDAMEASRLKSEFLATMSHEIRTPMNGVIGLTDLLLRTPLDDHQRKLTENLQGAGLTLLAIINDILDLSKIEAGKLELEAADFDVREVLDQVAGVLGGPAHEKGLELVVGCSPDVPLLVRGDSVRFGQVVTNLGSNAVKFTDHGEVVIGARVERRTPGGVVLRVDVTDTGVGIAAHERERLFEAFTQGDPSTTRRHGGTGLGLAISRQLVEALGGDLRVESEPGQGSTFSFTARFDEALRPAPAGSRALEGRRVLVVDDNATNRRVLGEQLEHWGLRPVAVAGAHEGLATLREAARSGQPFEVAVLDLVMPGTPGLELARQIRQEPALADVALLLLSSDRSVSPDEVEEAGVQAALGKPVRHAELRATLLSLVGATAAPEAAHRAAGPGLGLHVLVVEDNRVNQLVATGILEHLGCTVDVASDGLAAVARLTAPHDYDAVLMDCRMPRLDGFDATRQVREREPDDRHVPIIAMTASALEGERERCLAAGMDDYLTKPVDAAAIERVLLRWTRGEPEDRPESPPGPAVADGVLDTERIEMLDGLVKDGVSFFQRTAASFTSRIPGQLAAIRDALDRDNANGLLTSAHLVKGSALNLGLPRVARAAQELEALGIAGTTAGSGPLLTDLTAEVDLAVEALQRATERH